ncbi:hypothetical protein A3H86_01605 [Candidatus Roizmanbacteria bacterium RIFCSPLOWO2_02_FULL_41_9]|uniref:Ribulose phosphate epimerase n=1 Tax=Candidatus Roizmanbacteria bacterium RIFCSPLOWO2_02_FULL_41_9 TaxID=1802077 RepID=A0A1F7JQN6_9BACT|nr:MAG: hypothetical protein A3H86_01605 [Candidatus Roizmanbacteria bacterium RIFCSPLOWO2_02_FULL_41_9]
MQFIPTILTTNKEDFEKQILLFPKHFSRIQLDVADGILVSNVTTQIPEMVKILATHYSLLTTCVFDFHLMVKDFNRAIADIIKFSQYGQVGAVLINISLSPNLDKLTQQYPAFSFGLDVNPDVTIRQIFKKYDINLINNIQLMSVYPGFQGAPFIPNVLNKVEQLRKCGYKDKIFMDGGINDKTLPVILSKKFVPDFLCIGSYLTRSGAQLASRLKYLRSLEK